MEVVFTFDAIADLAHVRVLRNGKVILNNMKPKIFIGSSFEGRLVASAINAGLQYTAESKVWTHGVFNLSEATASTLMREVRESDFGVFVFSADDSANIRGKFLSVPRDNVIYELGLFSGALGPERCFFVTPMDTEIHLPSDLLGMTAGCYETVRSDQNIDSAVAPVCHKIERKFKELGFRHNAAHDRLLELALDFEACRFMPDEKTRLATRDRFFNDMIAFVRRTPVNKLVLLNKHRLGFYMTVAAAIVASPEDGDSDLLLCADRGKLPRGQAQHKIIDAMQALKKAGKLKLEEKKTLLDWANGFESPEEHTLNRLRDFNQQA